MSVRVVIVDDHRIVRQALRRVLEDAGITVVGEAADGISAIEVVVATRPNVALMDVTMPGADGIEVTRQLRTRVPDTRVLVLSASVDAATVDRARRAGATGYLSKDAALEEVVEGVRRAAAGALVIGANVGDGRRWLEDRVAAIAGDGRAPVLSPREAQVLALTADGLAADAVADRLVLSSKTVRNHLSRIYRKLGVGNRADAIVAAVRAGMLTLD